MSDILTALVEQLRSVFDKRKERQDLKLLEELSQSDEIELNQAYAVLLVDLALIDQEFHEREYAYIFSKFQEEFDLTHDDITLLIHQATNIIASPRSTESFANYLKERLTLSEREKLMGLIEGLITADSVEHGFELYLKSRYSQMLGLKEESKASDDDDDDDEEEEEEEKTDE